MRIRHVGNNWFPLLAYAFVFLFSGAFSMVTDRGNGAVGGFFAILSLIAAAVSAAWLLKHPSWWLAPRNYYLNVGGGALAATIITAFMPFLHGTGPWLVLGASLIAYGRFEQLRLLVTVGGAVTITGLLTLLIHVDVWGGAMHLLTTGILAFAAHRLYVLRHGRRRESLDSAPDFIGIFEDVDPNEVQRPIELPTPGRRSERN